MQNKKILPFLCTTLFLFNFAHAMERTQKSQYLTLGKKLGEISVENKNSSSYIFVSGTKVEKGKIKDFSISIEPKKSITVFDVVVDDPVGIENIVEKAMLHPKPGKNFYKAREKIFTKKLVVKEKDEKGKWKKVYP